MEKIDIVYKVVSAVMQDDHMVLHSSLYGMLGDWDIIYQPGRRMLPRLAGSYLYAFFTNDAAQAFLERSGEVCKPYLRPQIWEARAQIVTAEPRQALYNYEAFWKHHYYASGVQDPDNLPCVESTVWCEWIELTDMVFGLMPEPLPKNKKSKHPVLPIY